MQSGTIKFFNDLKGFGFIAPINAGPDIFVGRAALAQAGIETLHSGERVVFDTRPDRLGRPVAIGLQVLPDAA